MERYKEIERSIIKKFRKSIDKGEGRWYNIKAVAQKAAQSRGGVSIRSLKIEQQRESTKQSVVLRDYSV